MEELKKMKELYETCKKNKHRLPKEEADIVKKNLFVLLNDENMWDVAFQYILDFPVEIGISSFLEYYKKINYTKKDILKRSFVNNEYFLKNERDKSVKRAGVLVTKLLSDNENLDDAYFFLKKMNHLILAQWGVSISNKKQEKLLDIFDNRKKIKVLEKDIAIKDSRINNMEQELDESLSKISDLQFQIHGLNTKLKDLENKYNIEKRKNSELVSMNKDKDSSSLKIYRNKLAGKLRPDYKNIKEIKDVEVTEELGEVIKLKLFEVYDILIDNDIELE